jgi:4a-hydroxytetrahydrobiopterin dehydratase
MARPTGRPTLLTNEALAAALPGLPDWSVVDGELRRTFVFPDFGAAFAFMTRAALAAERLDHHPDWRNVWSRVEVRLTTHDAGGLTALDLALARAMDGYAAGG